MSSYAVLIFFLFLGAILAGGAMLTGFLLSPRTPRTEYQQKPYECGIETTGRSRVQFRVGYYLFALLFLVFDIEVLFLFPAASIFGDAAQGNFPIPLSVLVVELVVFIAILLGGLAYAWRKGALKWD